MFRCQMCGTKVNSLDPDDHGLCLDCAIIETRLILKNDDNCLDDDYRLAAEKDLQRLLEKRAERVE